MIQPLERVERITLLVVGILRHDGERQQVHHRVRHHVEQHRLHAPLGVAEEGVEQVAGVGDGRIRDHAAEALLLDRGQVTPHDRHQREHEQQIDQRSRCSRPTEQAHRSQQHRTLGERGHVGRDRDAGPFVGVGRPGVERHHRRLEEQGQQHQHHRRARHDVARGQRRTEGIHAHRARGAVQQRHTHQERGRRRAAEYQVLEGGFGALWATEGQQYQRIHRHGQQLEPQEHHQEAVRRRQQAQTVQRRQQQNGELTVAELRARHQQHRHCERQQRAFGHQHGRRD